MMQTWTLPLAVLATTFAVAAQDQESLIQKRDAKLAEDWVGNASWTTNFEAALAEAKSSGKLVFAYFTRSYAP